MLVWTGSRTADRTMIDASNPTLSTITPIISQLRLKSKLLKDAHLGNLVLGGLPGLGGDVLGLVQGIGGLLGVGLVGRHDECFGVFRLIRR